MTEAAASNPSRGRVGGARLRTPSRLLTDDRLARSAAAGDGGAFEEIFRRYHQDLYRFCLATAGNAQDAQDALQNTMVKVMGALPGEERHIKLKPWLYRIARNESVETVRRRRDSAELDAERMAATGEIAETAAARERLRGLFSDLEELPERQRAALVMRELGGLGFEEIGEAFETTPAVARQTLYEARQSLRQMEAGREMSCETVTRALSDADGRVTRRRDVRAHLRNCASCRAFREGISERTGEFAAIAPLPLAVSAGLLQGILGGQASAAVGIGSVAGAGAASAGAGAGGASGLAGAVGAGAGKIAATSAVAKSAATVAVVAAVGVGAAERGGVIDLPLRGGDEKPAKGSSEQASPSAPNRDRGASGRDLGTRGVGLRTGQEPGWDAKGLGTQPAIKGSGAADSGLSGARRGRTGHPIGPKRSGSRGNSAHGRSKEGRGVPAAGTPPATGRGQGNGVGPEGKPPHAKSPPGRSGEPSAKSTPAPQSAKPSKPGTAPVAPPDQEPAPTEPAPSEPPAAEDGAGAIEEADSIQIEAPES
jgi:RNA polymerase sigma factor (sigma-70 family)